MTDLYWTDGQVSLYHGDCREILPALEVRADCIVADPPYGETSLKWDRWPAGWLEVAAGVTSSLWCSGSMRMFTDRWTDFRDWKLSQDVIWEKQDGTGLTTDRFRRVHEHSLHFYRGRWDHTYHVTPRLASGQRGRGLSRGGSLAGEHIGTEGVRVKDDDGLRLERSVIKIRNLHARAIHPTEKPIGILDPLITYACLPAGLVIDPFAGSGSTLEAARGSGRRAIGIEANERYCEAAARRLSQGVMAL